MTTGHFVTSARSLLEAVIHRAGQPGERFIALNEVALARGETGRLVSVMATVNDELLNHYRADGLIVEVHPDPAHAVSDGKQSLKPEKFAAMLKQVGQIAQIMGRSIAPLQNSPTVNK